MSLIFFNYCFLTNNSKKIKNLNIKNKKLFLLLKCLLRKEIHLLANQNTFLILLKLKHLIIFSKFILSFIENLSYNN